MAEWDEKIIPNLPVYSDTKGRQRGTYTEPADMPMRITPRGSPAPMPMPVPPVQRRPRRIEARGGMLPLDELSHAELYALRDAPDAEQGMLAPLEHRAFAREWAQENPVLAGVSLPFAIPAYQLAKILGLQRARTPASMDEMMGGFHGYAEGMLNAVRAAQARSAHTKK